MEVTVDCREVMSQAARSCRVGTMYAIPKLCIVIVSQTGGRSQPIFYFIIA